MDRRHAIVIVPAMLLLAGASTAALIGLQSGPAAKIGGPFTLVDGDGKTVTDRDLLGKWSLVYFGYTHCPDACPTALADMSDAVAMLGSKRNDVRLVFITIDPARDTSSLMKNYVTSFGTPILALTGSEPQVTAAARAYRVYAVRRSTKDGDYEMDHSSIIYVMNPKGEFVTNFTQQTTPKQMAEKLQTLI